MQSLFAYELCKAADYQLAVDFIADRFKVDLNSMEPQDKVTLSANRVKAIERFEQQFKGAKSVTDDPVISSAIKEAFALYEERVTADKQHVQRQFIVEIDKITVIYFQALNLLLEWTHLEADSNGALSVNRFVTALKNHPDIKKAPVAAQWQSDITLVRRWYKELKQNDAFKAYCDLSSKDESADMAIIKYIFRKVIMSGDTIFKHLEQNDLYWTEDQAIIKSLLDKTLKSLDGTQIEIQKISPDWEEDKQFAQQMLRYALELPDEYHALIASNTRRWDVERLPLTDRVILDMAMAEMIHFPNIPLKVTINEHIELAKQYSTPNSRQFVNGILDVIAKVLVDNGVVRKSGRGLMDNK